MRRYALLGERLGHSLSVPVHEAIFQKLGLEAEYRLIELPRAAFAVEAARLTRELDGLNVTIPYKREIMPLLDEIEPTAAAIDAVNTVVRGNGKTVGHNTDAAGFEAALRRYGVDPRGRTCYILGSGGTAHTARYALARMGAKETLVVSRRPEAGQLTYDAFHERLLLTGGVIVNTTPAGMKNVPDTCPIALDRLDEAVRHASGVFDAIYNPPETPLIHAARAAGVPACNGLYMLIRQAVEAETLWQGYPMPDDLTDALMKELTL